MAFRSDISVEWYASPRYITIAAPSTTVTLQDLHDTLADIQDSLVGAQFPDLIESGGKLGGGVTGVASTLQNAQILFEPRTTKLETGTITTPDTAGQTLTDSTALFQTNMVTRGDVLVNVTDGSHATVLSVESETSLTSLTLAGGVDNQYGSGDAYEIFDYEICSITGGDLFAKDDVGADITPILTSFGVTGPIVEQDTSPAAAPLQPGTLVDGTLTAEEIFKIIAATLGGKVSGVTTTTETFRNPDDTKDRVVTTLDGSGNRTSVTFDLT